VYSAAEEGGGGEGEKYKNSRDSVSAPRSGVGVNYVVGWGYMGVG